MKRVRRKHMSADERALLKLQIEQISAFLDHCYDGTCHDLRLTWTIRNGFDPVRGVDKHYSDEHMADYMRRKGKHSEVVIGFGDAYYGSASLGHMLHDAAYELREKLLMRLAEDPEGGALDAEYGPEAA